MGKRRLLLRTIMENITQTDMTTTTFMTTTTAGNRTLTPAPGIEFSWGGLAGLCLAWLFFASILIFWLSVILSHRRVMKQMDREEQIALQQMDRQKEDEAEQEAEELLRRKKEELGLTFMK